MVNYMGCTSDSLGKSMVIIIDMNSEVISNVRLKLPKTNTLGKSTAM